MDSSQSLYDTPGSLLEFGNRRNEPWQSNDGMELRLVDKDEEKRPKAGIQSTLSRSKPLMIGPKFSPLERSADEGCISFGSSQLHVWKYVLGLVVLSLVVSVVAAILASVALKNSGDSYVAGDKLLPARQNALMANFSGMLVGHVGLTSRHVLLRLIVFIPN